MHLIRRIIAIAFILAIALPISAQESIVHGYRLITLDYLPTATERIQLQATGIELVEYLGDTKYLAKLSGSPATLNASPMVASIQSLRTTDKLSHAFARADFLKRSWREGKALPVVIRFSPDIDEAEIRAMLSKASDQEPYAISSRPYPVAFINLNNKQALRIASDPAVRGIRPYSGPPEQHNADSAALARVDKVREQADFFFVDGSGEWIAVVDGGSPGEHPDYEDRFQNGEKDMVLSLHASHVSGTIAGAGLGNSQARGMAPKAHIVNYSNRVIPFENMFDAHERFDTRLANNSWGNGGAWRRTPVNGKNSWIYYLDDLFSTYGSTSEMADETALQTGMLLVFSASNHRGGGYWGPHYHRGVAFSVDEDMQLYEDFHPPNPDYGTLDDGATAKNVLTVGATEDDGIITHFSSRGPTDDGRIKPDVSANGRALLSTSTDGTYFVSDGTSMAAPTTTGTAALLRQLYREVHGGEIDAVTLKNLIIHSSRDVDLPGPEYSYGYGLVDALQSATLVKDAELVDSFGSLWQATNEKLATAIFGQGTIDHRERKEYPFRIRGKNELLRVSVVWHDQPGEKLVNNINIWLTAPGSKKKIFPYRLDPKHPELPAKQKRNRTDNVEMVEVFEPPAGRWTLHVHGKKIPLGPQDFSLILTVGDHNSADTKDNRGALGEEPHTGFLNGDLEEKEAFDVGERIWIKFDYQLLNNGVFRGHLRAVRLEACVYDESEKLMFFRAFHSQDQSLAAPMGGEFTTTWFEPGYAMEWMSGKRFRAVAKITLHNGEQQSCEGWFSVN